MLIFIFSGPGLEHPAGERHDRDPRCRRRSARDAYWAYFGAATRSRRSRDIGKHLILPVITLVVVNIAGDSRFVRASMLETLSQDYVRTAKAKGLPARVVTFKHALRNALLPVITNIGLEIPFLFTGAIVTETIFSWPGIGKLTIDATRELRLPDPDGRAARSRPVIVVFANLHRRHRVRGRRPAHQVLRSDDGPDHVERRRGPVPDAPRSSIRPDARPASTTRSASSRSASGSSRGASSASTGWR